MPKRVPELSPSAVKNARPRATAWKLADGKGLFLLVLPDGAKQWRFKYHRPDTGKENLLALGAYPDVSLSKARERRAEVRALLADGIDPGEQRKAERQARKEAAGSTFAAVASEWLAVQDCADVTLRKSRWILETFLFPEIGHLPLSDISPRVLLDALRKIEATGKLETAKRAKIKAGQVFRWAIMEERTEIDPTGALRGALKSPKTKHHASITDPAKIGGLLRAIEDYSGDPVTCAALRLAPLVFVRPGELRAAQWQEIDLDGAVWRIPGERMKMGAAHVVPLSSQAVAILRDLQPLTGTGRYVFPGMRSASRPMSENTINAALRRLGYGTDEMTGHGFRSMAASLLNEMGWNADAIERQLAHAESNKVRDAYTHAAQYLDERRRMMQAWADYLDGLRTGANVIPIRKAG